MDEEEGSNLVKYGEEFAMPKTEELKDLKAWGNNLPIILQAGRCTHLPPQGVSEEDMEAAIGELEGKDPTVERFREIEAHTQFPGEQPAWISRVVGDT